MKGYLKVKRAMDIFMSVSLIVALSPILLLGYLLSKIFVSKNALFIQERGGLYERKIYVYKLKTMKDAFDKDGNLLPDEYRICKVGSFLRRFSIDELPQLFNVLKGDMSMIGPRPLMISTVESMPKQYRRRSSVLPGITGLAQVNGRNNLKYSVKYSFDIEYVDNISFWLDLKIIFLTVFAVLFADDSTKYTDVQGLDDVGGINNDPRVKK
ncbi:sugar transferase [Intestinicryptomonas porci]|uniref:Sugar transferase n=1 Tax=Intestinicryptomonas porci TaxID=2926320 RepID=A0ABU4WEG1_9BACT|nr:sugar transferase [Opitutales bacterium CLA-KB-P66]